MTAYPPTPPASLPDVLADIVKQAKTLSSTTGAAIALFDGHRLTCVASDGHNVPPVGVTLNIQEGLSGQCFRTGKVVRCNDAESDDRIKPWTCSAVASRSILLLPIQISTAARGILGLFSDTPNPFSAQPESPLKPFVSTPFHP